MEHFPHCPNPQCSYFQAPPEHQWYNSHGSFISQRVGRVFRYRCSNCGRTFCKNTFSIDYWVKKTVDYINVLTPLVSGSGLWDMVRFHGFSVDVFLNRIERFARSCLAVHSDICSRLPYNESFATDGFESFSRSQFYPNNINIIAGSDSLFLYNLGLSVLRRKGRMTQKQREIRENLEKLAQADPKDTRKSMEELFLHLDQQTKRCGRESLHVLSDMHRDYPRALAKVPGLKDRCTHTRISSHKKRNQANPLFPVNYCDRQFRKDMSDHTRETVQFARCPSAMMSRMAIYQWFHNCGLPNRVREHRRGLLRSRAEVAGISRKEQFAILDDRMKARAFLSKLNLDGQARKTWLQQWRNPGIELGRYVPKFIWA